MEAGFIIDSDIGNAPGIFVEWLMKAAAAANRQEIFSRYAKMFESMRVAGDKQTTLTCPQESGNKKLLNCRRGTDDRAVTIRSVMATNDNGLYSRVDVQLSQRVFVPCRLICSLGSRQFFEIGIEHDDRNGIRDAYVVDDVVAWKAPLEILFTFFS